MTAWFDTQIATAKLLTFFQKDGATAADFGRRVYQTFEATTFAQVIKWYVGRGWQTQVVNPQSHNFIFRLKFSTRGDAKNYTYVKCTNPLNPSEVVQVRHQIRVETYHNIRKKRKQSRANIVCDVAVVRDHDINSVVGNMHVGKEYLVTFAEAKHMDAYAELVAAFIGLVHELQPWRISQDRRRMRSVVANHPKPFLNITGVCLPTAEGIKATVVRRRMDIEVHDSRNPFS